VKSSKSQVRVKYHAIPDIQFTAGHRLTAFAGLVVFQRMFQALKLRARLAKCFLGDAPGVVFNSAWMVQLLPVGQHDGRNLTADLARVTAPLLTVLANADGICPPPTVLSGDAHIGSAVKATLVAGDDAHPMAHADLFISELAEREVFVPLADWLDATGE